MAGKRRWFRRRHKFGFGSRVRSFKPRQSLVKTFTVSSMAITANNVASGKTFTYANILPDVNIGRAICIHKIVVDVAMAGGTAAAASGIVQGRMANTPWSAATNLSTGGRAEGNSTNMQRVTIAKPTRLVMGAKLSGQKNWVVGDSSTICIEIFGWAFLATTLHLGITVYYEYDNDNVISSIA